MRLARLYAILAAFCAMLEVGGMNTRKGFIRDGFGLAAILAAQSSPAILVRSMAAARNGIMAAKRGGGWINPYVTDGLVAMWDGEWNAGGGVHDANATAWKDLAGASEIALNDEWSFGDNNLYVPSQLYGGSHIPMIIPTGETGQLDLCFSASGYLSSYGWILDGGLGLGNARGPCFDSPLGANADFPAGTSMELRYWPESTLEIKRPYAYSVSFDGSNGRRITDGVISQSSANTGDFNGVSVFNAYNYYRPVTGRIFNIRLYSRALTAEEIAANYAIDKARFNLT